MGRGATVIPQSTDPSHVRENAALFDWEVSAEDCHRIDDRDRNRSVYNLAPTDWSDETFGVAR